MPNCGGRFPASATGCWTNSHLHDFEIKGKRYGDLELIDDGFEDFECVDSTWTKLRDILPKKGKRLRFKYEYDFSDGWEHKILFEGCHPSALLTSSTMLQ
ncbi:MAG: plasmid pRiA4b ORF-3 family protein [Planctomycetes bacterium]|nr:plasmid pRiA4b ORF-3 family protein [Planctomycetota bacterium]